jgi:hypothetical protein
VIAGRTRGELSTAGIVLASVVLLLAVGYAARGWWGGAGGSYAPGVALVRTDVGPTRSLFGEVLTARARILVDPRRVNPSRTELAANFKPYRIRQETRSISNGPGRSTLVEFTYALQCTSRECLPRGGGRAAAATVFRLPRATATLFSPEGRRTSRNVAWPAFAVQSRLTADEIGLSTPKAADLEAPPPVSWRFSPTLIGGVSVALALLLVLGATWLLAIVARRDLRLIGAPRIPSHLSPVDRALALAEHAAAHGEIDESRKALERLAIELRRRHAAGQAAAAERIAWSEDAPSPATVSELANAVRSNGA